MKIMQQDETVMGILDEDVRFSLEELCRSCFLPIGERNKH